MKKTLVRYLSQVGASRGGQALPQEETEFAALGRPTPAPAPFEVSVQNIGLSEQPIDVTLKIYHLSA